MRVFTALCLFSIALLTGCPGEQTQPENGRSEQTQAAAATPDPSPAKSKVIVDIKAIANKSLAEVERVLGKPSELTVTETRDWSCDKGVLCQTGTYQDKFLITFVAGKSAVIKVLPSEPVPFDENAITALGLPAQAPESGGTGQMLWRPAGFHDVIYYAPGGSFMKNGEFDVHVLPY